MLAQRRYRCYIDFARLWRASGVIISPGPYRSFRELSLAGSVDPVIWCPPTFVGNSGIEHSNGHRGFALLFLCLLFVAVVPSALPSYSAKAEYPVRRGFAVLSQVLWNTGSPVGACHPADRRPDRVAGDDSQNATPHARYTCKLIEGRSARHGIGETRCVERGQ